MKSLLPALVPSWRFFQEIEASPRIEVAWPESSRANGSGSELDWQVFRPRPTRVGPWTMVRRLFWNPWWNECLYLTSLSERVVYDRSQRAADEIMARIREDFPGAPEPRVRIVLIDRQGGDLVSTVAWASADKRP